MTKRRDEHGHPYANDPIKVRAIGDFIGETLVEMAKPGEIEPSHLEQVIETHPEYPGLCNSEYWLAMMHAATVLQAFAFEKFTHLITERDEDEEIELGDQSAKLAVFLSKVGSDANLEEMRDEMIALFPGITKDEWMRGFEMHDEAVLLDAAAASGVVISLREEMAARGWGHSEHKSPEWSVIDGIQIDAVNNLSADHTALTKPQHYQNQHRPRAGRRPIAHFKNGARITRS